MSLPSPVAALVQRARNAKSAKERHDTAYFAWEASVRLAVAARPPADGARLRVPAVGAWVAALSTDGASSFAAPPLLAAHALFREVGLGDRGGPRSVTTKALLEPFAAYRNKVMAHGAVRAEEFYERAAATLLAGLEAAWPEGAFWPPAARLLALDEPRGDLAPGAYLEADGRATPLYPWILRHRTERGEGVVFFNGWRRSPEYLDYVSGEPLRGQELARAFPALEADLTRLFGAPPAAAPEPEPRDPALFGDYRILGRLGAGGMGVVHLARQESLGRLVALKMLPPETAGDEVARRRLEREVVALSRCEHPNVVKILASGRDGARDTPYYAMELVEGPDLGEVAAALAEVEDLDAAIARAWERARTAKREAFAAAGEPAEVRAPARRTGGDRFRSLAALFRDAARGVHHLHEAGIIHRDLKPQNIMVTAGDHRPVVMDLGLAALRDATRVTRDQGALLGTLRYMAPEQLEGSADLDRRADVYALGATLYELAAGRPLIEAESEARVVERVLRADPLPPEKANPRIPRDLAVIIRKACARDRAQRYETADLLARDLDAFLEGRPIAARPPTLVYLLGLAVRRNRITAATMLIASLTLAAATGAFVYRLGQAKARAEEHRRRAEDLTSYMLFDLGRRLSPLGKLGILNDVATKAKEYYESLSTEDLDPDAQRKYSAALGSLSDVLAGQGRVEDASAAAELSLRLAQRLSDQEPRNPTWLRDLGASHLRIGKLLDVEGRLTDALASDDAARAIYRRLAAADRENVGYERDLGQAGLQIATVKRAQADLAEALDECRSAIQLLEHVMAVLPTRTASATELAWGYDVESDVLEAMGRKAEAFDSVRRSLAARRRLAGAEPENVRAQVALARSQLLVGQALAAEGKLDEALASFREALEAQRRVMAQDPSNTSRQREATVLEGLIGVVLLDQGDAVGALASLRASLAASERLLAKDPTSALWQKDVAVSQMKISSALTATGDVAGALAGLEASLGIWQRLAARDPTNKQAEHDLATAHSLMGDAHATLGHLDAALASYRAQQGGLARATPAQARSPEWRGEVAGCHAQTAEVLVRLGDLPAAVSECALAAEAAADTSEAVAARAMLREAQGALDEALAGATAAIEADDGCREALLVRGRIRAARGDLAGATADLQKFLEVARGDARADEVQALLSRARAKAP